MLYRLAPTNDRTVFEANFMFYAVPEKHPTRLLAFHDLFFQLEGAWNVLLEDEEICLSPGDIAFLPAGFHHAGDQTCVPNTRTLYIHFEALPGDCPVPRETEASPAASGIEIESWTRTADPRLRGLFETMVKAQNAAGPFKSLYTSALLSMLLIELSASRKRIAERRDGFITQILDFLSYNTNRFYSIEELALKYGISPRGLTARFKAETGLPLHRYQMNTKLTQIAEIIRSNSYYSLKNLACNFGFYDEFHLSQAFKRKFGVSPKHYARH